MSRTNVMRLLEAAGIAHEPLRFDVDADDLSAAHAAAMLDMPLASVFKTLVLRGERTGVFVCCVPADGTIDLRKAAAAAGDKRAEMLPLSGLTAVTGYVRGGCSPIGMKRRHPVIIDESALGLERIVISAGARGQMVALSPRALIDYTAARPADIIKREATGDE